MNGVCLFEIVSIMRLLWIPLLWHYTQVYSKAMLDINAYCKVTCNNVKHTICMYRCKLGPLCIDFQNQKLTDSDRKYIRDLHNFYRNNVASGNDTRGGNGAGKDIKVMNYHKDIEVTTLCWARRCTFKHDRCRTVIGLPGSAGQNLFELFSSMPWPAGRKIFNMCLKSWYGEIKLTTKKVIEKFHIVPEDIGHYTQMLWDKTMYVACSRVAYRRKKWYIVYIVCNYTPAGNVLSQPVYKFGSGCTAPYKPNSKYPALCGAIDEPMKGVAVEIDGVPSLSYTSYVLLASVALALHFT